MNKFFFSYNVPADNTVTNDPSLSLQVEVKILTFSCSDEPTIIPEVIAGECTDSKGERCRFPKLSIALVIRVKDWLKVYSAITQIADQKYQQSLKKSVTQIAEEHYSKTSMYN